MHYHCSTGPEDVIRLRHAKLVHKGSGEKRGKGPTVKGVHLEQINVAGVAQEESPEELKLSSSGIAGIKGYETTLGVGYSAKQAKSLEAFALRSLSRNYVRNTSSEKCTDVDRTSCEISVMSTCVVFIDKTKRVCL